MKSIAKAEYIGISVGLIIISQIYVSCTDSLEKYLFEYDYMDPFVVLMYEGIFGYLLSFFLFFSQNFFDDIRKFNRGAEGKNKIGLVFSLIFYIIISGGKNLFRIVTNKIYSPMTKTLSDYALNPLYLIYYHLVRGDFKINGKLHPWYFFINIILALIISFK
jgi:hypothetical protein